MDFLFIIFIQKKVYFQERPSQKKYIQSVKDSIALSSINIKKDNKEKYDKIKLICLIIFTRFFNFIGATIRSNDVINFGIKEENNSLLEIRVRGIQILISALLCYKTLRLNIYKHQKISLIFISFFLIILLIVELIISINIFNKIIALIICFMSCLFRSFLDVTEKYLFDFEFVNIFKMIIHEGLIGLFFYIIYFLCNNTYQIQGKNILKDMSEFNWSFVSFILLIILYLVVSGFRNAYRVTTNKYYSPMSRALFESTLDPLLFLYNTLTFDKKEELTGFWLYFSVVLFCLFVIAFFSLVYNDFIVLYCCGLNHDTYSEITNRLYRKQSESYSFCVSENGESDSVMVELKDQYLIELKG